MKAAYLVEAYLAENWDRCSALCSKLLDMAHLLVEFGVFRLLFLQNNEKNVFGGVFQYVPSTVQSMRLMTNHKFRELVARAKSQCDLAKKCLVSLYVFLCVNGLEFRT
jgi:hypothetical protein